MSHIKFGLYYYEQDLSVIQKVAEENNFKDVNKFIFYRLLRELDKIDKEELHKRARGKRKRAYIRLHKVNNSDALEKLNALTQLTGIPAAVLIKRFTTDPILVQAQVVRISDSQQTGLPESP